MDFGTTRIALTSAYILAGLAKLLDFAAAEGEQEYFSFHAGWVRAWLAIMIAIIGPLLIITGRLVWLAAGALGVLTPIARLAANNFWGLLGQPRSMATNAFFEHIGLIAGFVLIAEHKQLRLARFDY